MGQTGIEDYEEMKERAINILGENEDPVTHSEIAEQLDVDSDTAGEVMSDLVVENIAATNADWDYMKI